VPEDDVRLPDRFVELAAELDARDPLAAHRSEFVLPEGVLAYLDGNSLGRPLRVTAQRLAGFVDGEWGERLIRAWDERWLDRPTAVGRSSHCSSQARISRSPHSSSTNRASRPPVTRSGRPRELPSR